MSAHTPGPWAIPVANVFRVVAPNVKPLQGHYPWAVVADTDPDSLGGPEAAATARLIAAAPELLEALVARVGVNWGCGCCGDGGTGITALDNARAAIAKATGGAP